MGFRFGYRRIAASLGWWFAGGFLQRLTETGVIVQQPQPPMPPTADTLQFPANYLRDIEQIRDNTSSTHVHTWFSKEFDALAYEDFLVRQEVERFGPKFVSKHNTHLFSQTYEDATIAEILSRIAATSRTFIEIGCGGGEENVTRLLLLLGWRGVWIEGNRENVASIRHRRADDIASGRLTLIEALVTAENVQTLLDTTGFAGGVDVMSIDIDQNTSHVWRAIRTPARIACVEYNANFPPSVDWEVPYEPAKVWDGTNIFGASLKRLQAIATGRAMSLVGCDLSGANAYFVSDAELGDHFAAPYTAEHHYQPPRFLIARGPRGHLRSND
jgi:hypothetical protein